MDIFQKLLALPAGAEHAFSPADLRELHWWQFPNKPWEPRNLTPQYISRMYGVDLQRDEAANSLVAVKRPAQMTERRGE